MTEIPQKPSPEGLSANQEKLAGMLFDMKTVAPVNRRRTKPDGSFEFYKFEREMSIIDFPVNEEEFAIKKHETDPGAPLSPIYVNLRNLPEEVLEQFGVVTSEIQTAETPDFCAGIPKAGVDLAKAYSKHSGIPVAEVFEKEESTDGSGKRRIVAGQTDEKNGRKLRIVDDLATGGDTKLEAVKAAEAMGYEVTDILVLVDRLQGAGKQLKDAGYVLHTAFDIDQLLRFALRTQRITKAKYDESRAYLGLAA